MLIQKTSNITVYSVGKSTPGSKAMPVSTTIVTAKRRVTMLPISRLQTLRDTKINSTSDVRVVYLTAHDDLDLCDPALNKQLYVTINGDIYECFKLVRHTQKSLISTTAELYVVRRSHT